MRVCFILVLLLAGCADLGRSAEPASDIDFPEDDESPTDAPGDDDDDDDDDSTEAPAEDVDDATFVGATFPDSLECGEITEVDATIENTGTTTWLGSELVKLGAVDDDDPMFDGVRVWLPDDAAVGPGESWTFSFTLQAPDDEGTYLTDWQMLREAVHWFGDVAERTVTVTCPVVGDPPLDLNNVTWLHPDVSGWPVTSDLASVGTSGSSICLDYDAANVWPINNLNCTDVVGNPWIFIYENNQWYGATWEWLRPSQTCKAMTSVAGDHIKQSPFDAASGWTPTSGTTYYFMVSGLVRLSGFSNVQERTQPVPFVWP